MHCQDEIHLMLTSLTFKAGTPEICLSRHFMPELVKYNKEGADLGWHLLLQREMNQQIKRAHRLNMQTRAYVRILEHVQNKEVTRTLKGWDTGDPFLYSGGILDSKTMTEEFS